MKKIIYYKTTQGVYFALDEFDYRGERKSVEYDIGGGRINGRSDYTKTHKEGWLFLENETSINKVEKKVAPKVINVYWELKNSEDVSLGLPLLLSQEESQEEWDDDDDAYCYTITNPKYARFSNLYQRREERDDGSWKDISDEYEFCYKGEFSVENLSDDIGDIKLTWQEKAGWSYKEKTVDLSSIARYNELEEMLIPDLVIHNRPCSVDVETTYKIIRNYVKENINGKYARVKSDYDFCFSVDKVIPIKPYELKTEVLKKNNRSYAKPRFNTKLIQNKTVEVFEMCPKPYQKYTTIKGFSGKNLRDLADNIKSYLEDLVDFLNTPLVECECCQGVGHVLEKFDKNKR